MLGLLLLETRFERLPGDLGREDSWPVPVAARVVQGAVPRAIVRGADAFDVPPWADAFAGAASDLVAHGAQAITTSCGFLVLVREALQARLPVPVVTSSLELLPDLLAHEARVGVLTVDASALGRAHLRAAGVPDHRAQDVVVQGVAADGPFARRLLAGDEGIDARAAGGDVVRAARALCARAPGLRSIVLECTNMPPHAQAVREATGCEVFALPHVARLAAVLAAANGRTNA